MLPISLIVPFYNEKEQLPAFLQALSQLKEGPKEIIFVDGGSNDLGDQIIAEFKSRAKTGQNISIIKTDHRLFPGAARNKGIRASTQELVAFIDVGIIPRVDWIKNLFDDFNNCGRPCLFGSIEFYNHSSSFQKAVCALSSGQNAIISGCIPNSLMQKDVFDKVGPFEEQLRSAEDLLWKKNFIKTGGSIENTPNALSDYTHFPKCIFGLAKKYFIYAKNTTYAQTNRGQVWGYIAFFALFLTLIVVSKKLALALGLAYLFFRGIVLPAYKSSKIYWWKNDIKSFLLALLLGPIMDGPKLFGFLYGLFKNNTPHRVPADF